jgi:hypothetical protein
MSGYKTRLDPALENELATTPTDRLFDINLFDLGTPDTSLAYSVAKRGVQLRVAAASLATVTALAPVSRRRLRRRSRLRRALRCRARPAQARRLLAVAPLQIVHGLGCRPQP